MPCIVAAALMNVGAATAQTPPDAGSLLQQIEQQRRPPLPPRPVPPLPPPPPLQSLGSAMSTSVASFRFAGNTLLSADQLAASVAGFLNRPLTFTELQNAAAAAAAAYRQAGWVVRAYLPRQDITNGVVTIQIVEAVFGAVRVEGGAVRADAARLESMVEAAQPAGTFVNGDALDRALLLIDDLPGLSVTGRLAEGRNQAETDLVLLAVDDPMLTGDLSADNAGARSTGAGRAIVSLGLNSPLRIGDRGAAILLHSRGADYVRAAYHVPLGSAGWRVGMSASFLSYKVVTEPFAQFDAHGTSSTLGVEATYPLIRSRLRNLYVTAAFDDKRFDNRLAGATITRYSTRAASVGLNGNMFDNVGGGGANGASVAFVAGRVDLSGSANEAADAATTATGGSFEKLVFAWSRRQVVTDAVSLFAGLSGQAASKNLDSSEKIYLGGPAGVRAYPVSEGGGSEGALLNLEIRARLPANLNATGFYDWGSVRVNKRNDIIGAAAPNRYDLQGVGVSVGWIASSGPSIKASLARRIRSNPGATASGNDQDGTLRKYRLWLQANVPF